jgi:hypothetical protein
MQVYPCRDQQNRQWPETLVTMKATPAIQTTVRYTQVNRAHVKEKLKLLKG